MRIGTISTSVFLILFSLIAYFYIIPTQIITSIPIDKSTPAVLHPDFFPRLTIVILFLVSFVLLFSTFKEELKDKTEEGPDPDRNKSLLRVIAVFILIYLYVVGLKYIGFSLMSPVFMTIVILLLGVRDWRYVFSMAVLFPLVLNYSFWYTFKVILPEGEIFSR